METLKTPDPNEIGKLLDDVAAQAEQDRILGATPTERGIASMEIETDPEDENVRFVELMGGAGSPVMLARTSMEGMILAGKKMTNAARFKALGGQYPTAYQEAIWKAKINLDTEEGKGQAGRLARWCLLEEEKKTDDRPRGVAERTRKVEAIPVLKEASTTRRVEAVRKVKENEFSLDEERQIIQNCLDQVFIQGRSNVYEVIKGLLGKEGYIAVKLKHGKEVPLSDELNKMIDSLGLDNWIAMKNLVGHWADFKGMEEIKPSSLTSRLFMDEYTEQFFAHAKCVLPYKNKETGKPELRPVDLGEEISKAMKKMREYFEGSVDVGGNPVPEDQQKPKEYWIYIGADLAQKEQLYTDLGLNRYVAETAFSILLSYQMLTDTSSDDYLSMMVQQARSRIKKYGISEDRDAFVRMLVQSDMAEGKRPFTSYSGEELKQKKKEMENRLAKLIPNQMIPTGLSGEGMAHLKQGDWLKWRVDENLYTRTKMEIAKAKGEEIIPATDQGTRLTMMQSALDVLTLIKEIQSPESDISKLAGLTSKLYRHVKANLGDAHWLIDEDGVLKVPADISPLAENGQKRPMELREWVSRTMLSVDEMFLYTHSIVDHKNGKPLEMGALAENAEKLFTIEVQSEKGSFVGMSEIMKREHRNELVKFVDRLWRNCYDLTDKINRDARPEKYPVWYRQGTSASSAIAEVAKKARISIGNWLTVKRRLHL